MTDVIWSVIVVCSLSLVPNILGISRTYFSLQSSHVISYTNSHCCFFLFLSLGCTSICLSVLLDLWYVATSWDLKILCSSSDSPFVYGSPTGCFLIGLIFSMFCVGVFRFIFVFLLGGSWTSKVITIFVRRTFLMWLVYIYCLPVLTPGYEPYSSLMPFWDICTMMPKWFWTLQSHRYLT